MTRFHRTLTIVSAALVLGAALGASGCVGTVAEPEDQAAAQQTTQRKGALGRFSAALVEVELRADQRAAVDGLLDEIDRQAEPVRASKDKIATELAREVRAGRIDSAKIDPMLDELAQAAETLAPAIEDAANKLHATLDASQREDLVDVLRDRAMERRGEGRKKMQALAETLGLTSEQKAQIIQAVKAEMRGGGEAQREKFREGRARIKEIAEAFQSDSFDARAFGGKQRVGQMLRSGGARIVKIAGVALPILTPEQRGRLADEIVRRAAEIAD